MPGWLIYAAVVAFIVVSFSTMLLTLDWMESRRVDLEADAEDVLPLDSRNTFPYPWFAGGRKW